MNSLDDIDMEEDLIDFVEYGEFDSLFIGRS